jgi:hypothetical protein
VTDDQQPNHGRVRPPFAPATPGEIGWCVRDALCELLGWAPGSEEWSRFVESREGQDIPPACRAPRPNRLRDSEGLERAHCAPGPWKRGWPLGDQHLIRGPVLGVVILDERQPARAA